MAEYTPREVDLAAYTLSTRLDSRVGSPIEMLEENEAENVDWFAAQTTAGFFTEDEVERFKNTSDRVLYRIIRTQLPQRRQS